MTDTRKIEGGSRLLALPSSGVGRFCAGLLVAAVVAVFLNSVLLMPFTESRGGLDTVQWVANLAIGLCIITSGLAGLWAVVRLRERSWVLFLAIVLTLLTLTLNIADQVHGGAASTEPAHPAGSALGK